MPIRIIKWFYLLGFLGGGGGLGFMNVDASGRLNFYYHVPIQIITMVLPFRLLGGWGGG